MSFFVAGIEFLTQYVGYQGFIIGAVIAITLVLLVLFFKKRINIYTRALRSAEKGNVKKAKVLLSIEIQKNPSNKEALLRKADIEFQSAEYAEAEKDYYRLIDLKAPGDGVDDFEVKKKLLLPLYAQDKLYETYKVIKEILNVERSNADALYFLGLIYLGQLLYEEAFVTLQFLIRSRPRFHQALFAACVAAAQKRDFEKALELINRALGVHAEPVYSLVKAGICAFLENFSEALRIIQTLPSAPKAYERREQFLFYLRLSAFCHYMKGSFDRATELYKYGYSQPTDKGDIKKNKGLMVYDEFGRLGNAPHEKDDGKKEQGGSVLDNYYRLKEVAIESGKGDRFQKGRSSSTTLLDLEGLTHKSREALNVGFCLIKAGHYREAYNFMKDMREKYPEIIGLRRILDHIDEKIKEESAEKKSPEGIEQLGRSTQRIIRNKKKRYELWEYIETWEREIIRPFQLMSIAGFTTNKQLRQILLLNDRGNFPWFKR